MEETIFDDLERLFEECDDVSKTFYKTASKDYTIAKEANCGIVKDCSEVTAGGDLPNMPCSGGKGYKRVSALDKTPKMPDSGAGERFMNHDGRFLQTSQQDRGGCISEFSKEEGECSSTQSESDFSPAAVNSHSKPRAVQKLKMQNGRNSKLENSYSSFIDSSKEEGGCSTTGLERRAVLKPKMRNARNSKPENSYSSFIDSSKEEGECSTTSYEEDDLDTTIKAVSPECSYSEKENDRPLFLKNQNKENEKDDCNLKVSKKRKRSLSEKNESTPKRRNIFLCEDVISPIGCCSVDKRRNPHEIAETPVIESKYSLTSGRLCSSTPVNIEQKFVLPSSDQCSTPIASVNTRKQNKQAKKEIIKKEVLSDSDSEFQEFSDTDAVSDKHQTLEELIADITKLCEESDETLPTENETVMRNSCKSFSKIEVNDLISKLKTDTCEEDNDRTLAENTLVGSQGDTTGSTSSDVENLTVVSAIGIFEKENTEKEKDESGSDNNGGRFKAEVTVSRIEEEKGNETQGSGIDVNVCDANPQEEEIQYCDDLLNLNDYDDEGFVDENILENSHLSKASKKTVESKKTKEAVRKDSDKSNAKKIVKNVDSLFNLVETLREKENKTDTNNDKDINTKCSNVMKGLNYAEFDTSIYRKKDNTAIEREVCRRWGTKGSADPDVNLTVATTKRNKHIEKRQRPEPGFLEGEQVVCTYLYEEEIISTFDRYGKTDGQSDLCYMPLERLLRKLYIQKEILENMNKQSLFNIKSKLQYQLQSTKERHCMELDALQERQAVEAQHFMINSRHHFNPWELQNNLMQLRQEHAFQERSLRENHRCEYNSIRSHGMEILNQEISRHNVQCEPIYQLIAQLEKPEAHAISSPQKYGPPIVVSLRKGPCRTSDGKHTTVAVCLSAGIAQAMSLEDDLYDHYYSY